MISEKSVESLVLMKFKAFLPAEGKALIFTPEENVIKFIRVSHVMCIDKTFLA